MKHLWKRMLSALLLLALVLSLLPGLPMKAEAGGIIPGQLATVDAGQELTIETQGVGQYDVTHMVFQSMGNTIATIVGYDRSGEIIMDVAICDDDYFEQRSNVYGGSRFEIKVLYGQIKVTFNTVGSEDPICTYYEFGDKLDWLVKPTIHEVYMKVGDTATLNVSQVTEGFSARANDYEDNYSDVARVSEDGTITARSPGTTTVYMQVLFWQTSSQYFYFWVPCTVHVIEDYTLDAYWNGYYAEPGEKYFNIVAYRPDGMRDVDFTITVGDQSYSTGTRTNALVPIPADYTGTDADKLAGGWHFTYLSGESTPSKEQMAQLIDIIKKNGGMFVNVHPLADGYVDSPNPLDHWYADWTGFEVFYGYSGPAPAQPATQRNYAMWKNLLTMGKKVWCTAGSDKHSMPNTDALSTVYSTAKDAKEHFEHFKVGDFVCGPVGIRMIIGDTHMGSETDFTGKRVIFSVGDFHKSAINPTHKYRVELHTDKGIVFSQELEDPTQTVYFAVDADENAAFYRVEIHDSTFKLMHALGNPIWNTK